MFNEYKLLRIYIIIFTINWDDQTEWEQCEADLGKEVVYTRRNASVGCFFNTIKRENSKDELFPILLKLKLERW